MCKGGAHSNSEQIVHSAPSHGSDLCAVEFVCTVGDVSMIKISWRQINKAFTATRR